MLDTRRTNLPPEVSIIIPCFNCINTISRTLDSIFNQTVTDWEIICVIDGPDQKLREELELLKCSKLIIIELQTNIGAGGARNVGINAASGRYIAFIDSDDAWLPNKLELQLSQMRHHDYEVTFTWVAYGEFSVDGVFTQKFIKQPKRNYDKNNFLILLVENKIITSSVILKADLLRSVQLSDLRLRQDIILWSQLLRRGVRFTVIPKLLVQYDVGTKGLSSNKFKMIRANYKANIRITNSVLLSGLVTFVSVLWHLCVSVKRKFN